MIKQRIICLWKVSHGNGKDHMIMKSITWYHKLKDHMFMKSITWWWKGSHDDEKDHMVT